MRANEFITEEKKIARYNGLIMGYAFNNDALKIRAYDPATKTPLAFVECTREDKKLYPKMLWVHDDYRGKGIAKSMYDFLKDEGYEINRSNDQTNDGSKFWNKHRGEDQHVWEDEELVAERNNGTRWTGDEMFRKIGDEDIDEDMSRRGFLGALGGLAMGAAGMDASAKQAHVKPKTKSPSQQVIQQAHKQQTAKQATPTQNPQAEAMLYRTAKASGMKGSELAQFLAQTKHESWDHSRLQEKPVGDPVKYFSKKYDPTLAPKTAKILGNKQRGDGAKYHGRGFIQLTGRDNYTRAANALGIDLVNHPELASKPDVAAKIAVWYWETRVKPKVHNFDDTVAVTKAINNAMFGLEDRLANFLDYKKRVS